MMENNINREKNVFHSGLSFFDIFVKIFLMCMAILSLFLFPLIFLTSRNYSVQIQLGNYSFMFMLIFFTSLMSGLLSSNIIFRRHKNNTRYNLILYPDRIEIRYYDSLNNINEVISINLMDIEKVMKNHSLIDSFNQWQYLINPYMKRSGFLISPYLPIKKSMIIILKNEYRMRPFFYRLYHFSIFDNIDRYYSNVKSIIVDIEPCEHNTFIKIMNR